MSRFHRILLHHGRCRRHEWGIETEYRVINSYACLDNRVAEQILGDTEDGSWEMAAAWRGGESAG